MNEPVEGDRYRASDAERERVAAWLASALGEGRLDLAEYDRRVAAAYRAVTRADLAALTDDLPPREGTPARRNASRPEPRPRAPSALGLAVLGIGLLFAAVLVARVGLFVPFMVVLVIVFCFAGSAARRGD